MGDRTRAIYLGKSSVIVADVAAGAVIPGLTRIFEALVLGEAWALVVKVKKGGATGPTTLQSIVRMEATGAQSIAEADADALWATVLDSALVSSAPAVTVDTEMVPVGTHMRLVSGGITAATWNDGITIEAWAFGG